MVLVSHSKYYYVLASVLIPPDNFSYWGYQYKPNQDAISVAKGCLIQRPDNAAKVLSDLAEQSVEKDTLVLGADEVDAEANATSEVAEELGFDETWMRSLIQIQDPYYPLHVSLNSIVITRLSDCDSPIRQNVAGNIKHKTFERFREECRRATEALSNNAAPRHLLFTEQEIKDRQQETKLAQAQKLATKEATKDSLEVARPSALGSVWEDIPAYLIRTRIPDFIPVDPYGPLRTSSLTVEGTKDQIQPTGSQPPSRLPSQSPSQSRPEGLESRSKKVSVKSTLTPLTNDDLLAIVNAFQKRLADLGTTSDRDPLIQGIRNLRKPLSRLLFPPPSYKKDHSKQSRVVSKAEGVDVSSGDN